jgi:hypothetical protein
MPRASFALVIFQKVYHAFLFYIIFFWNRAGLACDPPYASCVTQITGMYQHTWLFLLRWGLDNFLPGLASNPDSPDFCFPCSWN